MRRAAIGRASAIVLVALAAACGAFRKPPPPVPPAPSAAALAASEWPLARNAAQQAAIAGRFPRADSILRAFTASFPGTEASAEATFFRGVFKLDPSLEAMGVTDAVRDARAALEAYIAGGALQPHYAEARSLLRVAAHMDSLHASVIDATRPVLGAQASRDTVKLRDEEIVKLKAELEQTKSEMERLRKRLSPRP